MLLSFSSFSTATLKLLNCVAVEKPKSAELDSEMVLFYAGAKQCGMWQLPVVLLLMVLVLVPLVPVCIKLICLLPLSWWASAWARAKHWPTHPVMQAMKQHALEPFNHDQDHWAAVLMLQRLLTSACRALSPPELQSERGVAIVSLWFVLLQAVVQPYRLQWVNRLQLLSAWCLVMLSILNVVSSSLFVSVGVSVASTPFRSLAQVADWAMFILLWPPPVLVLAAILGQRLKHRRGAQSEAVDRTFAVACG
jgi:hypothetical protein